MITITDSAKERIKSVMFDEKSKLIRFGLQGGGCNGFTYYFAMETERSDDDQEYQLGDEQVLLVDPMSMMYLVGAEIDYKRDIMGENFVFRNPNTTTSCGCGNSVGF